jgi:hypothetical protein
MKESLVMFQIEQDESILRSILKRSENRDAYREEKDTEDYIAAHIRSKREKVLRHAKTERSGNKYYWDNFQRLLSMIYYDLKIKFDGHIYKKDHNYLSYFVLEPALFESLRNHYDVIMNRLEFPDDAEFKYALNRLEKAETAVQAKVTEIRTWLDPLIEESLRYALLKVDVERDIQEIVKYVNRAFDTKYADRMLEVNGMTRVRKNFGKRIVKKHFYENPVYAVLEVEAPLSVLEKVLTKEQFRFLNSAIKVVEEDVINDNLTPYSCDFYGRAIIGKKYLGERLELQQEIVRKRISRMKKRLS